MFDARRNGYKFMRIRYFMRNTFFYAESRWDEGTNAASKNERTKESSRRFFLFLISIRRLFSIRPRSETLATSRTRSLVRRQSERNQSNNVRFRSHLRHRLRQGALILRAPAISKLLQAFIFFRVVFFCGCGCWRGLIYLRYRVKRRKGFYSRVAECAVAPRDAEARPCPRRTS